MIATKVTSLDACERVRQFSPSVLYEWVNPGEHAVTLESAKELNGKDFFDVQQDQSFCRLDEKSRLAIRAARSVITDSLLADRLKISRAL